MSITQNQPNTIYLGGPKTEVGDIAASEAICPGMLIERFNSAGIIRFRKHSTSAGAAVHTIAAEQSMLNKGVNDGYAANDLVEAFDTGGGSTAWMLIPSGQNITAGNFLESAGNGMLNVYGSGVRLFQAIESVNNTNGDAGPTNPPPETGTTTAKPTGAARIRVVHV